MILFGDINKGLKECRSTPGSVLVDVRERTEFASGHIAGAVNEPLSTIRKTAHLRMCMPELKASTRVCFHILRQRISGSEKCSVTPTSQKRHWLIWKLLEHR